MASPQKQTRNEHSAGGVVVKRINSQPHILIGKHSGYHKWVLPKGLIEPGETPQETAVRETAEEMSVVAKVTKSEPIHIVKYFFYADIKDKQLEPKQAQEGQAQKDKAQEGQTQEGQTQEREAQDPRANSATRRYTKYQEQGGGKTMVNKTVDFFLMEYVSGSPDNHGWEMSDAKWVTEEEAMTLMAFDDEKQAVKKALASVSS